MENKTPCQKVTKNSYLILRQSEFQAQTEQNKQRRWLKRNNSTKSDHYRYNVEVSSVMKQIVLTVKVSCVLIQS